MNNEISPEVRAKAIRLGLINEEGMPQVLRAVRLAVTIQRLGKPRLVPHAGGGWDCYGNRLHGKGATAKDAYLAWVALADREWVDDRGFVNHVHKRTIYDLSNARFYDA